MLENYRKKIKEFDSKKLKKNCLGNYKALEYCKNKNVLEIGFADHSIKGLEMQINKGCWLFGHLTKQCNKATGIDIASKAVKELKKQGFNVLNADAESFISKEKFDVIIAPRVLDHLMNFDGLFKCCSKNLKPEGKLIIIDDNPVSFPLLFYLRRLHGYSLGSHYDITIKPVPNYFKNFASKYDFEIEKTEYFSQIKKIKLLRKILPKKLLANDLLLDEYLCVLKKINLNPPKA